MSGNSERGAECRKCECVNIGMKINLMEYCKWLCQINAVIFIEVLFIQLNSKWSFGYLCEAIARFLLSSLARVKLKIKKAIFRPKFIRVSIIIATKSLLLFIFRVF